MLYNTRKHQALQSPAVRDNDEIQKVPVAQNAFLMIEASSRTTEVREALRELKRRIKESEKQPDNRIRPNDCAVFVPDMQA